MRLVYSIPNICMNWQGKVAGLKCARYDWSALQIRRGLKYVQGQRPNPRTREYFYYIDHQGMLFMDDSKMKNFTSCFKEKAFLKFFFTRLKRNETGQYESEFPYFSPCGRESNYIRCDDLPIVFTHLIPSQGESPEQLSFAGGSMRFQFIPESLCMFPASGRVYHPGPESAGGVGLIRSSLAIELSSLFEYQGQDPTHINWKGQRVKLTNNINQLVAIHSKLFDQF